MSTLSALVGDVATEVLGSLAEDTDDAVAGHPFLKDAADCGVFDASAGGLTVFLPLEYTSIDDYEDEFEELWNRHTVRGITFIGSDGVHQLTTLSNLVIAVYPIDTDTFAAAGVQISSAHMNTQHSSCVIHPIEGASLPQMRPFGDAIGAMRTLYVGGEVIEMPFESLGIEDETSSSQTYTLVVSFHLHDRTALADTQKIPWLGNGTVCRIVVPYLSVSQEAMLWFQLYDHNQRHTILTMLWPWYLHILPNVDMHPNPTVTAINPKSARPNDELWILGRDFSSVDVRVSIGNQAAHVFHCEPTLIRCFVPNGAGIQPVWVANGKVYKRFDAFTYA